MNLKIKNLLSVFSLLLIFTSCQNLTEKIVVNEDGSGTYDIYTDATSSVRMMVTMMDSMMAQPDENGKVKRMSEEEIEARVWKDFPGFVDSTLDITSDLPEDIKADEEKMQMVNRMRAYMTGGEDVGYVHTGMNFKYKNFDDLMSFHRFMEKQMEENDDGNSMFQGMENPTIETSYIFEKNKFQRIFKVTSKAEISEKDEVMLGMMIGKGNFNTVLEMPRKVKNAKGEGLKSIDGNTVIFEYSMMDYMKGEVDCSFEIIME